MRTRKMLSAERCCLPKDAVWIDAVIAQHSQSKTTRTITCHLSVKWSGLLQFGCLHKEQVTSNRQILLPKD